MSPFVTVSGAMRWMLAFFRTHAVTTRSCTNTAQSQRSRSPSRGFRAVIQRRIGMFE